MSGPRPHPEVYGEVVDRLVEAASADPRVRALWLEGDQRSELRRPYQRLEVHLAADEPDFAPLLSSLEALLGGAGRLDGVRWSDVPRFARRFDAQVEGAAVAVVLEKTSLLAKRGRSAVVALVDKTGHLIHVMDFSRPRP